MMDFKKEQIQEVDVIRITDHAMRRLAERKNKDRESARRKTEIVVEQGVPHEKLRYGSTIRNWITGKLALHEYGRKAFLHNSAVYIFSPDGFLVTCLPVPDELKRKAKKEEKNSLRQMEKERHDDPVK